MSDRSNSGLPDDDEPDAATELFKLARPDELVPAEFRDVSFGSALGGYNRNEVDAYVERVNRLIAELEISRSPEKAVQLALERVGEQTAGILQEAQEAAEKLTAAAETEAEHATRRARVEADELLEAAQKESRAMLECAAEESTDLLEQSQARLEAMRGEIADAQREHVRAVEGLRRTAAALTDFAELAAGRPPARSEPPPAPGETDPTEQPTENRSAVEVPGTEGSAQPRRRITGSRPPSAKREPAEAASRARPG
jgi:DivIVA domain-containing protein